MREPDNYEIERWVDALDQGTMSRRSFVTRATAVGVSFSTIAGVLATAGRASGDALAGASTQRSLKAGNQMTVAVAATPVTVDRELGFGNEAAETIPNLYETGLVYRLVPGRPDRSTRVPNFEAIRPNIYRSWKVSKDGKKLTIQLKRGVMSSYGNELTSADVKYAHDRAASNAGVIGAFILGILTVKTANTGKPNGSAVGVKPLGKYAVSIELNKPSIFLVPIQALGFGVGPIDSTEYKKHATAKDPWAAKWAGTHGQGFGAYAVETFEAGKRAVYVANRRYHRGRPRITRLIKQVVPEDSGRAASIAAGAVDAAEFLSFLQLKQLQKNSKVSVHRVEGNLSVHPIMNTKKEPFTDVRVRQALNYAVPREQIRKAVFLGFGRNALAPVPNNYPGFVKQGPWPYDLNKAKALLDAAGKSGGFTATLAYNAAKSHQEQIAQILLTEFAKIGVKLTLKKMPPAAFNDAYTKRTEQMIFQEEQSILADATYQLFLYYNSKQFTDFSNYRNARVDALTNLAIYTSNDRARQRMNAEAQKLIWNDAPWVWGWYEGWQIATRENVVGVSWGSQNSYEWSRLGFKS